MLTDQQMNDNIKRMDETARQRSVLIKAIVEAAQKAGIATTENVGFDGPTCLMLVDDMATYILRLEEENKNLQDMLKDGAVIMNQAIPILPLWPDKLKSRMAEFYANVTLITARQYDVKTSS